MDFDTLDWKLEAIRVARAFGLEGESEFRRSTHLVRMTFYHASTYPCHLQGGEPLYIFYERNSRYFGIKFSRPDADNYVTSLSIDWSGTVLSPVYHFEKSALLAKAFFYLDLLTSEVEAALQASISQHQKIEWRLEYEARYEL